MTSTYPLLLSCSWRDSKKRRIVQGKRRQQTRQYRLPLRTKTSTLMLSQMEAFWYVALKLLVALVLIHFIRSDFLQGICYSESKRKERNTTPLVNKTVSIAREVASSDDLDAESPLEMLRFALLQLSTLEESLGSGAGGDGGSIANITSLLQVQNTLSPQTPSITSNRFQWLYSCF